MREKLGQHFLIDGQKIKQIITSLNLREGDTIIEIGPGHGELTKALEPRIQNLESRIIAIEKDKELAQKLREKFALNKNIEIIEGDALKILPQILKNPKSYILNSSAKGGSASGGKSYKVVGNIPYYITGQLLRVVGDLITNYRLPITTVVLTIQKEVALRICAAPPKMNLLSASVRFWADPKIIDFISKINFRPRPRVDSAIVKLVTRKWQLVNGRGASNYELSRFYRGLSTKSEQITNYYRLIKVLFKQPRKTIFNNLKNAHSMPEAELLTKLRIMNVNPQARPQNLSLETIKKLALMLYNDY